MRAAPLSAARAVLGCKCPRCRVGPVFRSGASDLRGFAKMHAECPACGQDYRVEPGFYVGASYIHYGFTTVVTSAGVIADLAMGQFLPLWGLIAGILLLNAALFPLSFRIARMLMLHWFGGIRYDETALDDQPHLYVEPGGNLREGDWGNDFA